MRVAVLSDIHGNLEALEAVLSECDAQGADRVLCLGDVVGYGADPSACIKIVRSRAELTVAGNHDQAAAGLIDTHNFNDVAAEAIDWTQDRLSARETKYLATLPLTHETDGALFVHGSPHEPGAFHYIFGASEAAEAMAACDDALVFVGHSHRAFVYGVSEQDEVAWGEGAAETGEGRYLVNVGSVGQPRDGDPRAAFALWDTETGTTTLVRVEYDILRAQDKIREQGLPAFLASRLTAGE